MLMSTRERENLKVMGGLSTGKLSQRMAAEVFAVEREAFVQFMLSQDINFAATLPTNSLAKFKRFKVDYEKRIRYRV